jgi:hypothetical protein
MLNTFHILLPCFKLASFQVTEHWWPPAQRAIILALSELRELHKRHLSFRPAAFDVSVLAKLYIQKKKSYV